VSIQVISLTLFPCGAAVRTQLSTKIARILPAFRERLIAINIGEATVILVCLGIRDKLRVSTQVADN
jgi:hypothetical protein